MTALRIWDDAQDLLNVATAALDTLPGEDGQLAGAPLRRYLSDGLPSYDCPSMLNVYVATLGEYPAGPVPAVARVKYNRINTVQLVLTCIRCRPEMMMRPDPAPTWALNLAAKQHMADGWVLWNGVWRAIVAGQLFSKCDGVDIVGSVADDPSGGASGWVFRMAPITGGYDPIPNYVAVTTELATKP